MPKPLDRPRSLVRPILRSLAVALAFPGGPAAAAGETTITIAAVSTRGHLLQPEGGDVEAGVRAAVDRLNAGGGLLGRQLIIAAFDDQCSRAEAEAVAARVAMAGAALVVGHPCPGAAVAAAPIHARAGTLMIATGARHPRLTEPRIGPLVFRLAGRDDRLARELATAVAARFAGARVAIVHDKSVQARGLADACERELKGLGIQPILREAYVAGEKQYNALVDRLIAADIRVAIMPAQPIEAGIMLARLREAGHDLTMIGSDILAVPEIEATAKANGDRLLLMLPWRPAGAPTPSPSPSATHLAARAAIEAWAEAVHKAQSLEAAAVAQALENGTAATAIGPLGFDARGDALIPSYVLSNWREGRWQQVTP